MTSVFEVSQPTLAMLDPSAGADFSPCGKYRYRMWRYWGSGKTVLWIMLNPSSADSQSLDPTTRRCRDYSTRWGFDGMMVCNLFALVSTDPKAMLAHPEPVGPDNMSVVVREATSNRCGLVVAAWGSLGYHMNQDRAVWDAMAVNGVGLQCLGTTAGGFPRHPLYVRKDQPRVRYEP